MEKQFKTLEFIYQDMQIHFLVNPHNNNVMINATEMAKVFGKEVDNFLRLSGTKDFINELISTENFKNIPSDVREYFTEKDIVEGRKRGGTFMHRKLALKFAAWLDVKFELWIFDTIDSILFGNYKKHWEAHQKQEDAKLKLALLKDKLLKEVPELAIPFFEAEKIVHDTRNEKQKALQNQYKIDLFKNE